MRAASIILFTAFLLAACSNEYYVKTYKTTDEIAGDDQKELRNRFTTIDLSDVYLHLEWNTYDNFIINRAPYKLFVVSEPKSSRFSRIEIESVSISSSLDCNYVIQYENWPAILTNKKMERDSITFEPAFKFMFGKGEIISTTISIRVITEDSIESKTIELQWHPMKVKHYAPIV